MRVAFEKTDPAEKLLGVEIVRNDGYNCVYIGFWWWHIELTFIKE